MSIPGSGNNHLAKLATIFAIGFAISLGLCGVNFLIVMSGAGQGSGGATVVIVTAYLELAGMVICGIGMVIVGVLSLIRSMRLRFSNHSNSSEDQ